MLYIFKYWLYSLTYKDQLDEFNWKFIHEYIIWIYMYSHVWNYWFSQENSGIYEIFFYITIKQRYYVTEIHFSNNCISFLLFIRSFYIDLTINLLTTFSSIIGRETFHTKISVGSSVFLYGILLQNQSTPFRELFKFWTFVFTLSNFFLRLISVDV